MPVNRPRAPRGSRRWRAGHRLATQSRSRTRTPTPPCIVQCIGQTCLLRFQNGSTKRDCVPTSPAQIHIVAVVSPSFRDAPDSCCVPPSSLPTRGTPQTAALAMPEATCRLTRFETKGSVGQKYSCASTSSYAVSTKNRIAGAAGRLVRLGAGNRSCDSGIW